MVNTVSYTDLRANLSSYLQKALDNRTPITVTRQGSGNVVILSQEEYESWEETIHLLKSPKNSARLLRSISAANAGETMEHKLVDVDVEFESFKNEDNLHRR